MHIQIENLSVSHKRDLRPLIENLSFVLRDGDRCAVIGEEGNGKSTLLKIIACPEEAAGYADFSGSVRTGGAVIGYLKEELSEAEKRMPVTAYLAAGPGYDLLGFGDCVDILNQVGFDPALFRRPGAEWFVTPRNIDSEVDTLSRLLGLGISAALHVDFSVEDVEKWTC